MYSKSLNWTVQWRCRTSLCALCSAKSRQAVCTHLLKKKESNILWLQTGNYGARMNLRASSDATVSVRIDNQNALAASYIPQPVLIIFQARLVHILVQEGNMSSKYHKRPSWYNNIKNVIIYFFILFNEPTNAQFIDKSSDSSYMFRPYCVVLREFVDSTLLSYTFMLNAVFCNTI